MTLEGFYAKKDKRVTSKVRAIKELSNYYVDYTSTLGTCAHTDRIAEQIAALGVELSEILKEEFK